MDKLVLSLAGINISFLLRNQYTLWYLRKFGCTELYLSQCNSDTEISIPAVTKERLKTETTRLGNNEPFAEYSLLLESIANPILRYSRFFFHGAAFLWNEKVFLFTGKSGVGKTTMLRNWLQLYPAEIEIVNGDKPVIEQRGDEFIVYPSPWTGKEGWNGTRSSRLASIICLEQGKENHFTHLDMKAAAFPIFLQFLYTPSDVGSVDLVCGYTEKLLNRIPIGRFVNDGTPEAAKELHDTLSKEMF